MAINPWRNKEGGCFFMIRKNNSHESVVCNYFFATGSDRHHFNKGSRIFFEGDILYSYGYHFPLAVKSKNGYVLNGALHLK